MNIGKFDGFHSLGFLLGAAFLLITPPLKAGVTSSDITLQAPQTANLPVISAITAYDSTEANATTANMEAPLYGPYDNTTDAWWDNLVSEQIQARLPVVMLSDGGAYTTNPNETGTGLNPRRLVSYLNALHRAGGSGTMQFGCFAGESNAESIYRTYYGLPGGTKVDFSNQDSWNQIWWLRIIKPWFDTVPASTWYKINGKVPIEFWGLNDNTTYTNQQGNISQLFNYIATQMQATYGVYPAFIMGSLNCDTTLASCTYMIGDNEWFGPPSTPYTVTTHNDFTVTGLVAGYINPGYYTVGSSAYQNANTIIPRNGVGGTGNLGDTFNAGLTAALDANAPFNIIEGFTDISESCGLYRSLDSHWSHPNQYLNILASYTDLRTVTQRLIAAGCDENNATTGNLGGAFLRASTTDKLSVRALTGAPAITASSQQSAYAHYASNAFDGSLSDKWYAAVTGPWWLQYDYGAGNTEVVNGYAITSATDTPGRAPAAWQFEGSNNGTSWTVLDTQTGQTFAALNQTNTYTYTNSTNAAYEFYRLNITAVNGATDGAQLAELNIHIVYSNGGGWAVTNTAAGEYLQWDTVNFSTGNYKFPICYSSTAAHTVTLSVDGTALTSVSLPSSGSMNTFTTAYLGTKAIAAGTHTLKLTFVDGGPDVQWIFAKKYDPMMTFFSTESECYLTAESGGNDDIVSNRTTAASWENFSVDDMSGAGSPSSGDTVNLQVDDGLYITAEQGGNNDLSVNRRVPATWEQFKIIKVSGSGVLANGDQVALQTSNGANYVTVKSDGSVDTSGDVIGQAETFTIGIGTQ